MAKDLTFHEPAVLRLSRSFESPYEAVVKPHVVMGVTRYFLERWVPVLGTGPATVVNTLRQLAYRTPSEPITITGEALAREAAMSRRHLYTCLQTPWMHAFVRRDPGQRVRSATGRVTQQTNRYRVQCTDPLNPADAEQLLLILPTLADGPLQAVKAALNIEPRRLWASSATVSSAHFPDPACITAQAVLQRAFPTWRPADTDQERAYRLAAKALHSHVTLLDEHGRPKKIIVPQYFRQQWWTHLGHDLAWTYLWLRGEIYENQTSGVSRPACWIASLDALLGFLNRPYEWWRRNVEKAPARNGWTLREFFAQTTMKKGLNSRAPQQVARQFVVALDLPIAPQDRGSYSTMLINWPDTAPEPIADSESKKNRVCSNITGFSTDSEERPLLAWPVAQAEQTDGTHSNTLDPAISLTFLHTGAEGVPGTRTQVSLTTAHRESESLLSSTDDSRIYHSSRFSFRRPHSTKTAAASKTIPSVTNVSSSALIDQLVDARQQTPDRSLAQIVEVTIWLQQAWPEPIQPHTPAWDIATSGTVTPRELVALMLSVCADSSVRHPPRYLSWLMQRWCTQPDVDPVSKWNEWLALADLPIGQWDEEGRQRWLALVAPGHVSLPFGLDIAIQDSRMEQKTMQQSHSSETGAVSHLSEQVQCRDESQRGLNDHPGTSPFTIVDIWRATLGQLSLLVGRSTYTNWVEGSQAIAFEEGILTVRARHHMARELLAKRLNKTVEETVSALAQVPITVRYVL